MLLTNKLFILNALVVSIVSSLVSVSHAEEYFDPDLLNSNGTPIDLNAFSRSGYVLPGKYLVDIYMNGKFLKTENLVFDYNSQNKLVPVLSIEQLDALGVNTASIPGASAMVFNNADIRNTSLIPNASFDFDFGRQQLNIYVAQIYMKKASDAAATRQFWEQGIPAIFANYSYSGSYSSTDSASSSTNSTGDFLQLNTGANYGPWRLRSDMTWTQTRSEYNWYDTVNDTVNRRKSIQHKWNFLDRYLQRDIQSVDSELTLGDYRTTPYTDQMIEGFSFRGISLASSEAMTPAAIRGYAPVISGIANSNAVVTVTQNGYTLYQMSVAPGPFRIEELPGGSTSGDIHVTIKESDGTVRTYRQAYSTLPAMQREGAFKYELSAGRYKNGYYGLHSGEPDFINASVLYGLPGGVTAMGNLLYSENYNSASLGTALSLGTIGSVSATVTSSETKTEHAHTLKGYSVNAKYNKNLTATGTNIQLASYRYSTPEFRTFTEANSTYYQDAEFIHSPLAGRRKDTWSLILNQNLGRKLGAYVSGRKDHYWDRKSTTSLSAGLSGSLWQSSWSLGYSIERVRGDGCWPENREVSFSLSVPFSAFSPSGGLSSMNANLRTTHNNQGRTMNMAGLNGRALEDGRLSWNISENWSNTSQKQGREENFSFGASLDSQYARINGGYGRNMAGETYNYGISGSVLAHSEGLLFSQQSIGDAGILVHVPDVPGARVMNGYNIKTNDSGYALVPYAATYERNHINIDPGSLPDGVEIDETSKTVYPTKGAFVRADYKVHAGQQALINIKYQGKPVPLGAFVTIEDQVFIVGYNGQVYVSGVPGKGRLKVKWGDKEVHSANYNLGKPVTAKKDGQWTPIKEISVYM
ncbi:fimbria/pilus outer membrane usher protein [Escherichia coli]|uniref:fimbria/pilus outer membrane usher protein n=1 Tax=Escherichia coli TaxID=562 RepID=UPI003A8F1B09